MKARVTVESCIAKSRAYYAAGNLSGGSLHIVLDDGNTARGHVEWCRDYARGCLDADGFDLAEDLLELTDAEVARVYRDLWAPERVRQRA